MSDSDSQSFSCESQNLKDVVPKWFLIKISFNIKYNVSLKIPGDLLDTGLRIRIHFFGLIQQYTCEVKKHLKGRKVSELFWTIRNYAIGHLQQRVRSRKKYWH